MSSITTRAPACTRANVIDRPKPILLPAPVTIATLPSKGVVIVYSVCSLSCVMKLSSSPAPCARCPRAPTPFTLRELVGLQNVVERLRPGDAYLCARLRVVAGPHDPLRAECVDGSPQHRQRISIRIRLLTEQVRRMAPLGRQIRVLG
jgi:hypothetical protein